MGDAPTPDIIDEGGRMSRLIYALIAGAAAAALAYFVTDQIVRSDPGPRVGDMEYSRGGYRLVYYVTALAGGAAFFIVGGILEGRAKKRWLQEQEIAHARLLKK